MAVGLGGAFGEGGARVAQHALDHLFPGQAWGVAGGEGEGEGEVV